MTLTRNFRKAHADHPDWSYKQIAELLYCDINVLRGINSRIKLPVPVRAKAPDGQAKQRYRTPKKKELKKVPQIKSQANRVYSKCGPTSTGYTKLY